jgi:hypothetical protein
MGPFSTPSDAVKVEGYPFYRIGKLTLEQAQAIFDNGRQFQMDNGEMIRCNSELALYLNQPFCQYTRTPVAFFGVECDAPWFHKPDRRVWNLRPYALVGEVEVQLTKDHIIPRAWGGSDFLENYQPLLDFVNEAKANKVYQQDLELAKERQLPELLLLPTAMTDAAPRWTIAELTKMKGQSELKSLRISTSRLRKNTKSLPHPLPVGTKIIKCTLKRFRPSGKYIATITGHHVINDTIYYQVDHHVGHPVGWFDCCLAPDSQSFVPYTHPAEILLEKHA